MAQQILYFFNFKIKTKILKSKPFSIESLQLYSRIIKTPFEILEAKKMVQMRWTSSAVLVDSRNSTNVSCCKI
jgi:hypothetical protein